MLRLTFALILGLAAAGCSQPCDRDHLCTLDADHALCDGNDYVTCDGSHLNKTIACAGGTRVAVCTPDGWAFENSAPH